MKEESPLNNESWYENLSRIASLPPEERFSKLVYLHETTIADYLGSIESITEEEAAEVCSDGRTRAQVVAHVMAWEEWQTQVFSAPNKSERIKQQMQLRNFYDDSENKFVDFESVDDFNAYQERKYTNVPWSQIQEKAIRTAKTLQSFFIEESETEMVDFLESTDPYNWKLTDKTTLTIPSGWYLWMVSLEHEVIEHRNDLEKLPT